MMLTCNGCRKRWDYKGKKTGIGPHTEYTSCPRCHGSVKVKPPKVKPAEKEE